MTTVHEVKCVSPYFDDVWADLKPFEVRFDDRNYKEGDFLLQRHFDPTTRKFFDREVLQKIIYVLRDFEGLNKGWVVLGTQTLSKHYAND